MNTANIGKRSKGWRAWRPEERDRDSEHGYGDRDHISPEYYDDPGFINETQGADGADGSLSGIPRELWDDVRKPSSPIDKITSNTRDLWDSEKLKSPISPGSTLITRIPYVECHTGNVHVFTIGNISVYGGGSSRGLQIWEDTFIIDMGDVVNSDYVQFAGCSYPELYTLKLIKVKCRDYGVPDIGHTFWVRLVDILKRESVDKPIKVVCCCMGGHGRTGIALSILSGLFDMVPVDDCPVTWVRQRYCKSAVESHKQLKYIEEVTGRKVTAKEPEDKYGAKGGISTTSSYYPGQFYGAM